VRFTTGIAPFLNARVRGLSKLGKGAKKQSVRFGAAATAVGKGRVSNFRVRIFPYSRLYSRSALAVTGRLRAP